MKYLIIFLSFFMMTSCSLSSKKKHIVTDFSKKIVDTITPDADCKNYSNKYFTVKGFANDTVSLKINEDGTNFYFVGKIDTLINGDYYGTFNQVFYFDPYKAKNGKLEIEFGMN